MIIICGFIFFDLWGGKCWTGKTVQAKLKLSTVSYQIASTLLFPQKNDNTHDCVQDSTVPSYQSLSILQLFSFSKLLCDIDITVRYRNNNHSDKHIQVRYVWFELNMFFGLVPNLYRIYVYLSGTVVINSFKYFVKCCKIRSFLYFLFTSRENKKYNTI